MDDPWYWAVDDVVANLCKSRDLWIQRPNSHLPDSEKLEQTLRKNSVDGSTLLDHVDSEALKNDLSINTLGERAAILYAIEILRSRSPQYVSFRMTIESRQNKIRTAAQTLSPAPTPPHSHSILPQPTPVTTLEPLEQRSGKPEDQDFGTQRPTLRPGEYLFVEGGKKRRKLQLKSRTEPEQGTLGKPVPKLPKSYLSHNMVSIDSLFYGDLRNGSVLLDDPNSGPPQSDLEIFPGEKQQPCRGTAVFVHRRMRHFLMSDLVILDNDRVARYPYPEYLVKEGQGRSATLFKTTEDGIFATKRDATLINFEGAAADSDAEADHSWDHLLSKWPVNGDEDEVLPLYNESESENEYPESLFDEMEQELLEREQFEKGKQHGQLQKFDVCDVIQQEITHHRKIWRDRGLTRRQSSAWTVWKKSQGRARAELVKTTTIEMEKLSVRLQKLIRELSGELWTSEKSLRNQCRCLHQTVESQEDGEWRLQLWSSAKPPPRLFMAGSKRVRRMAKDPEESNDGDSLGSVSDDMDDFVDIDEIYPAQADEDDNHNTTSVVQQSAESQTGLQSPNSFHEHEGLVQRSTKQHSMESRQQTSVNNGTYFRSSHNADSSDGAPRREMSEDSVLVLVRDDNSRGSMYRIRSQPAEVIDLTALSPTSLDDTSANQLFTESADETVEGATEEEIGGWEWTKLDEQSDRKRIVLKHLHSMDQNLAKKVQLHFAQCSHKKLREQVRAGLGAIKRGDSVNVDQNNRATMEAMCKLFVCWNDGSHRHFEHAIPTPIMESALKAKDLPNFLDFFKSISKIANESDSDTEDDLSVPTPRIRKKRRNKVLKNRPALALREIARARKAAGEARAEKLKSQMALSDLGEQKGAIVVNNMKKDEEGLIYLNTYIAKRIKPHQIEGIRFLWREVVRVEKPPAMQGCLLAHTMGLGKSMQAISLLVTVAEAATSGNPAVVDQIPPSLRQSRTLILCPPGLIENWKDEFQLWTPPSMSALGSIFDISGLTQGAARLVTISKWYNQGGILIIGYEMFRSLVLNKPSSYSQLPPLTEEQHEQIQVELLQGPNIVVADEAHRLKHQGSGIAQAARRFRTTSRIALTGSPLANNLQDYFAMIDWVAVGYLGDITEFKANYQEPIEAGTYADSTIHEQKKSIEMLNALLKAIDPKVDRADITAIQDDLKPKTEFVIKLPLTKWQTKAYSAFVRSVLDKTENQPVQSKLFDWMNFLALLCSHPSVFLKSLSQRAENRPESYRAMDQTDGIETPTEWASPPTEISGSMVARQLEIAKSFALEELFNHAHSFKMAVMMEILVEAKKLHDRVLVFSQHIATLDYIESLLARVPAKVESFRLDGSTKMEERLKMVKLFNSGNRDVFLISTKAGGLGLNISGANRVILVDFSFNPMHEEQAVGRAYRIGQQKEVFVYHLVTGGTYEEILHNTTIFKRQLAARVVDKKNPTLSASKGVVYLFEPRTVEQEDLNAFRGKDKILDHILAGEVGPFIRGLKTAETMHAERNEPLTEE